MFRYRFLRSAAVALAAYGVLGLFISMAMLVVGTTTFGQVASLQATLESERVTLVKSIRTVSGTLHDTAGATTDLIARVAHLSAGSRQRLSRSRHSRRPKRSSGLVVGCLAVEGHRIEPSPARHGATPTRPA